jgi:hypothetical protein
VHGVVQAHPRRRLHVHRAVPSCGRAVFRGGRL